MRGWRVEPEEELYNKRNMAWKKIEPQQLEELTEKEMEAITTVFRSFETGLREATIYPKV